MSERLPGLRDDDVEVFDFSRPLHIGVAKWWWRPVCWLAGRPTTVKVTT